MILESAQSGRTIFFFAIQTNEVNFALENNLIGYCAIDDLIFEAELLRICVHPQYRKKGIGEGLLLFAINHLKKSSNQEEQNQKSITLEVNATNYPAQGLYQKCGFNPIAIRKNYYKEEGFSADAIIMQLFV